MKEKKVFQTIGWREWLSLPTLGIKTIKAKVDTGARSSSLHAHNLEYFKKGKKEFARFDVYPLQRKNNKVITVEAPILEHRNVKSSSGKSSLRPVVVTELEMLGECWPIELTLANRDEMGFRMLLGRQAIRGRFLVNPGGSYKNGKPIKRKTNKKIMLKKKILKKKKGTK